MRQNRRNRTLEGLLTVNAVLLGVVAWTHLAERPLAPAAVAQDRTRPNEPFRFPNASAQRAEIVKELKDLKKAVEANTRMIEKGLVVEVSNLDEIEVTVEMPTPAGGDGGDGGD